MNNEWQLETKITKNLTDMLDNMSLYYKYEQIDIFGRLYLKVICTDSYDNYWPERYFCDRWVNKYHDKYPIDICNICIGTDGTREFCVAEICKSSWNSAPNEWKAHNRGVVGY